MGSESAAAMMAAARGHIQAIKASGVLVRVEPDVFLTLLARSEDPVVVSTTGGILRRTHRLSDRLQGVRVFHGFSNPVVAS